MNKKSLYIAAICCSMAVYGLSAQTMTTASTGAATFDDLDHNNDWSYYHLACSEGEWQPYFFPESWAVGYPDVVYPPEGSFFFPSGAGKGHSESQGAIIKGNRPGLQRWRITIPATGFLSLGFRDSLHQPLEHLRVELNGQHRVLETTDDGLFYTAYLRPGDLFSFYLPPGMGPIHWNNLRFHTNVKGVFVNPDLGTSRRKFQSLRSDYLPKISFAEKGYGGWPIYDVDGLIDTLDDRIELRQSTDFLSVSYQDSMVVCPKGAYVVRKFVLSEKCSDGNTLQRSVKWRPLPLICP